MRLYGLLGRTLKHSFSKGYFTQKFAQLGITDAAYENFELPSIGELPQLLATRSDLKGLNVTIPYKEEVLPFLTKKSDTVEAIGACNCIRLDEGGLKGFNTDAIGFRKSVEPQLKPHHKKALILGTGGASKAVAFALSEMGIDYLFVSRHKKESHCGYEDVGEELLTERHLLINTTPLGMYPNADADPPLPYEFITPHHFLFDLIYNPAKTKFLAQGEKQGAQICNGHQMLVEQAEESWRIWSEP